jgi:hypothetical protein
LGRTTTLLAALASALILVALLWASRPHPDDDLDQLRRATAQADAALHLARLGCELVEDSERRQDCHQGLSVAGLPLQVARGVLATADACALADEPCRAAQLAQARVLLPEVRRAVEALAPVASSLPADPEAPSAGPAPASSAPLAPGEGGL